MLSGLRYEEEGALDAVFEAVWNFCVFLSLFDAIERESAESECATFLTVLTRAPGTSRLGLLALYWASLDGDWEAQGGPGRPRMAPDDPKLPDLSLRRG